MDNNSEKCTCDKSDNTQESDSSSSDASPNTKKNKISLQSLGLHLRRGRSLHFRSKRSKKNDESSSSSSTNSSPTSSSSLKKSPIWGLKFNCSKREPKVSSVENQNCCKCTCYRRIDEHHLGAGVVFENEPVQKNEPVQENIVNENQNAEVRERIENNYQPEEVRIETIDNVEARNRQMLNSQR